MDEKGMLRATHKGNFKKDFGINVDCYVLNDPDKTAVISSRGMGAALELTGGGSTALTRFVKGKVISDYIGPELKNKLNKPLIFNASPMVMNSLSGPKAKGYDVTILIDVCKAVIAAEKDGKLTKRQQNVIEQAHTIVSASAKSGIKNLVYALSGYDVTKQEIIEQFKLYVREEARKYEKEFPDELYEEWYRIYRLPKPTRNRPFKFMHLTMEQVYRPLAKSRGTIQNLIIVQRTKNKQERNKRLHQFLSDIGVKVLRRHLGRLLGIAETSKNETQYEARIIQIFGGQMAFDFPDYEKKKT